MRNLFRGALFAVALLWPLAGSAQSSRGRIPSSPGPFAGGVTAQGRIVPAGGVLRLSAPSGITGQAIVKQLMVKEGDSVETGQLLAVLRGQSVMKAQADAADADQSAAAAALTQAHAAQTRTAAELNAQLADLVGRAATADAALHRAIEASQLALEQAKSEESAAKAAFDNAKALQLSAAASTAASVAFAQAQLDALPRSRTTERTVATAQLEQAKAEKKRADTEVANQLAQLQAQADLASLRTKQAQAALITEPPAAPANLSPEQAQARAAHAAVDAQKILIEATNAENTAAIASAQAHLAAATASAAAAQAQLALTEIRAPSAGRVLAILTRPGEAVGPGGILQLGDTRDMYVDALVYIDDVPSVHLGQKTMVTGSALPDDGLTGQVVTISPMVAGNTLPNPDPTVFSDQPVVLVKVRLDNPAPAANLVNGQVKVQFAP